MAVRRVVTGHGGDGSSVIVADSIVEPITTGLAPGLAAHEVWKVEGTATLPAPSPPQVTTSYYPPVNGVRFQVLTVPPSSGADPRSVDVEAELARLERIAPGIMAGNDVNDPGMHSTDSVDYVYLASGTIVLELGGGESVELHAGDTVVQQGARHAWRNHGDEPCVIVGTLVGATRSGR